MTQIPSNAIASSLTPLQRQQNDSLRARQVQSAKNLHHNEDVDELDDTGVDSIRDDQRNRGQQQQSDDNPPPRKETEDTVDIQNASPADPASPDPASPVTTQKQKPLTPPVPRLDISA